MKNPIKDFISKVKKHGFMYNKWNKSDPNSDRLWITFESREPFKLPWNRDDRKTLISFHFNSKEIKKLKKGKHFYEDVLGKLEKDAKLHLVIVSCGESDLSFEGKEAIILRTPKLYLAEGLPVEEIIDFDVQDLLGLFQKLVKETTSH